MVKLALLFANDSRPRIILGFAQIPMAQNRTATTTITAM